MHMVRIGMEEEQDMGTRLYNMWSEEQCLRKWQPEKYLLIASYLPLNLPNFSLWMSPCHHAISKLTGSVVDVGHFHEVLQRSALSMPSVCLGGNNCLPENYRLVICNEHAERLSQLPPLGKNVDSTFFPVLMCPR